MKLQTFSEEWPHTVHTSKDIDWAEAYTWLMDRALALDIKNHDLYTSFSLREYGFKDPRLAMEFKLRFG